MTALHTLASLTAAFLLLVEASAAHAQDTRADVIRRQQADRQRVVAPPSLNRAELIIDRLDEWGVFTGEPRGVYPWVGSIFPGGGIAAGAGVRAAVGDSGAVRVFGGYSTRRFWHGEASLELPTFARDRARVTLSGRYTDAPAVRHHGLGNDTRRADAIDYGHRPASGGVRLDVEVLPHLSVGGGVTHLQVETSPGRSGPPIEGQPAPAAAPALELGTVRYINSSARASFDWRRPAGYAGSGGLYRVRFDDYRGRDEARPSFRSLEAEVRQLIPLLRANWVLAIGGLATVTDIDDAGVVPHFLLPSLGGGGTLRGYPDFRFRDRHRIVMNAEVRWTPARFLDMAVFYDTGKVAARRRDLDFEDLHDAYGVGLRLTGPKGYAFRVEVARSREHHARVLVGAGGSF
jgi:hypothetical protein